MNINFFKLILMVFLLNTTIPAIAGKSEGANLCCHHCRISQNRPKKKRVKYIPCSHCVKIVYCANCIHTKLDLTDAEIKKIVKEGSLLCQPCQDNCCCSFKECKKNHKHCFTYKRTLKRHVESEKPPKWTKRKKDDVRDPNDKIKKSKKRKIKKKILNEREDSEYLLPVLESSSEEESRPRPKKKNPAEKKKTEALFESEDGPNEALEEEHHDRGVVIKLRRLQKAVASSEDIGSFSETDPLTIEPNQNTELLIKNAGPEDEVAPADFALENIVIATVVNAEIVIAMPVKPEIVMPEMFTLEPRVLPNFSRTYPTWTPGRENFVYRY